MEGGEFAVADLLVGGLVDGHFSIVGGWFYGGDVGLCGVVAVGEQFMVQIEISILYMLKTLSTQIP